MADCDGDVDEAFDGKHATQIRLVSGSFLSIFHSFRCHQELAQMSQFQASRRSINNDILFLQFTHVWHIDGDRHVDLEQMPKGMLRFNCICSQV